jgi:hypothetical protein
MSFLQNAVTLWKLWGRYNLPVLIEMRNDNNCVTQWYMYYLLRTQTMASVCTAMQMHKLCKAE